MKHTRNLLLIALLGVAAVGLPSLRGATFTVINTNDSGTGSLRQALADSADGDTINFASTLNGQTITLTSGQLMVNKSVTINGLGANALAVDGNYASRVFYIGLGRDVTVSGLTVSHGSPTDLLGGGIYNDRATLTVSSCTISGNSANGGGGGGIYNEGPSGSATLMVTNCTITGNSAVTGYGAGITNNGGTLTIANTTLSGNSAGFDGGGIANYAGTLTIANSTVSGNSSLGDAGGIYNGTQTTVTITNSTLSGNFCGTSLYYHGGGIFNEGGTLKIGGTILNAGPSGENIYNVNEYGPVTSLGYNLSSDNGDGHLTATGDRINTDPILGPLQNNGGPTLTHLPASNSPAIDAGDPTLGMDQRGPGFQRAANGRIDIGAIEVQGTSTPTPTPKPHGHR